MAGITITIKTVGTQKLVAKYSRALNFLGGDGIRQHLKERGEAMVKEYRKNVEKFTPGSVPDLTPKYKKRKEKQYGHVYPILVASGQLIGGMGSRVLKTKGWTIQITFPKRHHSGLTGKRLAEIHALGKGTQPVRNPFKLPAGFNEQWMKRFRQRLKRGK